MSKLRSEAKVIVTFFSIITQLQLLKILMIK